MSTTKLIELIIEVDNLLHEAQSKKENSIGINYPAIMFWGGIYVAASEEILEKTLIKYSVLANILSVIVAFGVLLIIVDRASKRLMNRYNKQILVYTTIKNMLIYIGIKNGAKFSDNIKDSLV